MTSSTATFATPCPTCGITVHGEELSCPGCGWLTRSADLESLSQNAKAAAQAGRLGEAIQYWEQAAALLPPDTVQYRAVITRIDDLRARLAGGSGQPTSWKKKAAGVGPVLLLLLSKGKMLLLGLTKLSTLVSMFAFFGVYWTLFGWAFALGLVLAIYVHEMGHVITLRRFGIPASAPMFIPGFGALIRTRAVMNPLQDSRVGLAGPIYGLGAALFCLAVAYVTKSGTWAAVAHAAGVMNMFNLIPVWQLDGARGLHSQTRRQRGTLLGITAGVWAICSQPMLLLIGIAMTFKVFAKDGAQETDNTGFLQYAGLLVALATVIALARNLGGVPGVH